MVLAVSDDEVVTSSAEVVDDNNDDGRRVMDEPYDVGAIMTDPGTATRPCWPFLLAAEKASERDGAKESRTAANNDTIANNGRDA